ncbi:type II toxin-antitoxin system RelE/ParE family toxin [Aquimarina algiphila]|uniref:Type II toxin-antitoxin system RelE/ParE family toxin n=1 Tax=Aquimarina algiphila TaxID=2047982 RepID=A0A554VF92_9FLAO|nr:type II toxin-antitoxin system RelE/ParE family toxin [Aquimarina algiphila]TSE05824.1 type II toxin-antitoxin system RelE/ParE family toxin [Aquimarina algiphila]
MNTEYTLSPDAEADLYRIWLFGVSKFGEAQADKYFFNFFNHFDRIANNPYQFRSVDHIRKGYRVCICGVDAIYYKVNKNTVEIMAIIGSQDINDIL